MSLSALEGVSPQMGKVKADPKSSAAWAYPSACVQFAALEGDARGLEHGLGILASLVEIFQNAARRILARSEGDVELVGLMGQSLGGVEVDFTQFGAGFPHLTVGQRGGITAGHAARRRRLACAVSGKGPGSAACRRD